MNRALRGGLENDFKIHGIPVTGAKSLCDRLTKARSSPPTERQTLAGLLVARDLQESGAVKTKWFPNRHMIAGVVHKKR